MQSAVGDEWGAVVIARPGHLLAVKRTQGIEQ
jgi:hypothetical protein